MNRLIYLAGGAVLLAAAALSSVFVVDERNKALVLEFGQIVAVRDDPGLYFKLPLIQEVVYYDKRILGRDIDPLEITPSDDRRLVVDAFVRYRISDVVRFRKAVGVGGEEFAQNRLDKILIDQITVALGNVDSSSILSERRTALAGEIRDAARKEAASLGLEIVDVRLRRTELPSQNREATFARMRAERQREATDQIARGQEAAQRLRATADRTVVETVSDATRQSEIIRGEADATRTSILATAYGADPEFFAFYRSLSAYKASLKGQGSTFVLSPDSPYFDYLQSATPPKAAAQ